MKTRGAVFLDRDGTIIRDANFIGDPALVELLPGAAAAVRRLNEAGWPVIVVTNQSGVGRGFFTTADYERVRARLDELLSAAGAHIDASYACPHHPNEQCDCRKPGTLLYRQAAEQHGLDLAKSWYIGDRMRDVTPAQALGGRGILVPNAETSATDTQRARKEFVVAESLDEAVASVIESAR